MSVFDEASSQRRQLGAALRTLRRKTGLSGNRFAAQIGMAQSTVSRIELGQHVPAVADLDRWLDATDATPAHRAQLHRLRDLAAMEAVSWRRRARALPALQQEVAAVEASSGRVCYWHPTLVPGPLQTPAYVRAVYEAFHLGPPEKLAETVAKRMDRQAMLYEEGRRFEFVIGEAALRWWPGPGVAAGQLDRLGVLAAQPSVTLGILRFGEVPVWRSHHFTLYAERDDGPLVHVEGLEFGVNLRDPEQVARYEEAFKRLLEAAVVGEEAAALLERVAASSGP